jgi:hypothetical protein
MIDIVTTLRRESFYRPTSRLNSDGKVQMGFELMSINLQAADEIERQTEIIVTLRQELKEAKARNTLYLSKIQEYEAREY